MCVLGVQQYGQKPYCVLLFNVLLYCNVWHNIEGGVYTMCTAHPMKC